MRSRRARTVSDHHPVGSPSDDLAVSGGVSAEAERPRPVAVGFGSFNGLECAGFEAVPLGCECLGSVRAHAPLPPLFVPSAARTIAMMPARAAAGRLDQTATIAANSGSVGVAGVPDGIDMPELDRLLPELLPPESEIRVFSAGFAECSHPAPPIPYAFLTTEGQGRSESPRH